MACVNSRCVDLCRKKTCGINSVCKIVNNQAVCLCIPGFTGNPSIRCSKIEPVKVCPINRCGPNTRCFIIRNKTVCKCLPNFVGDPWKGCRKQCSTDSVCEIHEKCIQNICQDACKLCGMKAICQKIPMQRPICKCPPGYSGNPYKRCKLIGNCITNAQCPPLKPVCKNYWCLNPCDRACGIDALCRIQGVEAVCTCPDGFTGDPSVKCKRMNCRHEHQCKCNNDHDCPKTLSCVRGICVDLCLAGHKCGINAVCQMRQHKAICICEAGLTGDPLIKCVPPCYSQQDCSANMACIEGRCVDLCRNKICGRNAVCKIMNNKAVCLCLPGFTGNPLMRCSKIEPVKICPINRCGPNTRCFIIKNKTVCKCLPNFVGDPWKGCRKQCKTDSVCEIHEKCIQNICQDACKLCGIKAICQKIPMQRPICKCPPGYTGNPYKRCKLIGDCVTNADCLPITPVCKNYKCLNPCHHACGIDALCRIRDSEAVCSCPPEYTGDPLVKCKRINCRHEHECKCTSDHDCPESLSCVRGICVDICLAGHRCGVNAVCQMRKHKAICICEAGLTGDPLIKCVPPCYSQKDCSPNMACIDHRCVDLCRKKTCGSNSVCKIVNNEAMCLCIPGFTGNPLIHCSKIEPVKICPINRCGPNTRCLIINNQTVCKCLPNFVGDPWRGCRKRCQSDSVCDIHEKCIQNICQDACKLCGIKAVCQKIPMQRPICKCPPGYTGNPYKRCKLIGDCITNADCPPLKPICKNYKVPKSVPWGLRY
ncbi:hypothetical protein WA026_011917 [Henosepilachna vigintioctopunctata]|uniref:EGF-like domain-containing protein n=1 Tax=Henosepilachna vigintioctopunctata TaxID=420089 RepID=A0AAW1ULM0_9CUCU